MLDVLIEALVSLHWTEGFSVLFGIVYVILAAKENVWCWFWGILSTALWAYAAYALYDLYIDALLQIYYFLVSFYGIYQWLKGGNQQSDLKIQEISLKNHVLIITGGLLLSFLVSFFFKSYTPAAATDLDAFTTVFSIIATYMITKKILSHWIYWMVINVAYIYLYGSRGSLLFSLLFVLYWIIAFVGYRNWKINYNQALATEVIKNK